LPFNWDGYLMQKGEEHSAEIAFRHYAALRQTFEEQGRVYRAASVLSPYLPVRFLSMAMCRTDYAAHWHFSDAAEKYRLMMMDSLNTHFARNSRYGDWDYLADKSLWGNIPEFTYTPRTYPEILAENFSNVATLLTWLAVSFGALFLLTKKFHGL
jgi:ABC-2 type transport system permease protein